MRGYLGWWEGGGRGEWEAQGWVCILNGFLFITMGWMDEMEGREGKGSDDYI